MLKIDYKKELKHLYGPSAKAPVIVEVPPLRYLMVDGQGDPNSNPAYAEAVEALFAVSYAVKFLVKRSPQAVDYGVMPLEGLWWAEDMTRFSPAEKSDWLWTMMIMQPEVASDTVVAQALAEVAAKKKLPGVARLRFETLTEGTCAQILHLGPFTAEGPTIARLHAFIAERGALTGKHHEIYLSDIRKANPAKWKTVIRQPMQ